MNKVILCADDFGLSHGTNTAILDLIQQNVLQATSVMVTMPALETDAPQLKTFSSQAQIGLHFDLTDGKPLTHLPASHHGSLKRLLVLSHLRRLNQAALEAELLAQLERFKAVMGRFPDFIDGHQHVHHLPVVRDALLAVYAKWFGDKKPWVRVSSNGLSFVLRRAFSEPKLAIIAFSGALSLKRKLKKAGIPHNKHFSGIYDFSKSAHYAQYFKTFQADVRDDGLMMCHPGKGEVASDAIAKARADEYAFLRTLSR
ncbi:MAG: hypothetical protein COV52_06275 [Gammaproteobacteria bacterium CG11_big_fil_rev_8_21_14_0_20_46_22]|nr:MAG: hypothetical protein COW05_07385 [Gammaproteobacteria bacterium CG12_big_fil_rev_8_21_14_0_65_46_12]PIR11107.1 MAG: hypothetical protein COV52_06275 [Gammaproteobacteria bacterium CG11_big_fil_rev_8_21_14_0_20_46_22]